MLHLYNNRESIRMHLGCAFIFFSFVNVLQHMGGSHTHSVEHTIHSEMHTQPLLHWHCQLSSTVQLIQNSWIHWYLSGRKEHFYMPKSVIYVHNLCFVNPHSLNCKLITLLISPTDCRPSHIFSVFLNHLLWPVERQQCCALWQVARCLHKFNWLIIKRAIVLYR